MLTALLYRLQEHARCRRDTVIAAPIMLLHCVIFTIIFHIIRAEYITLAHLISHIRQRVGVAVMDLTVAQAVACTIPARGLYRLINVCRIRTITATSPQPVH